MAGCAGIETSESQLFAEPSRCQSATIAYRFEHKSGRGNAPRSAVAKLLDPAGTSGKPICRVVSLAVQYPHPKGRTGYARVECIVAGASDGGEAPTGPRGWLARFGRLAEDTLPGLKMADGVDEALGLDVPIGELDDALAALQRPADPSSTVQAHSADSAATRVFCTINGVNLLPRHERVAELDRLVARVRRNGSIISPTSSVVRRMMNAGDEKLAADASLPHATTAQGSSAMHAPSHTAAAMHDEGALPAAYTQTVISPLPPVEPLGP